ncbi:MAG: hypothetical protein IT451_08345, partial [Candidatus Brocadia sp.]|nr:hypothetical protein [Candidatus Brocadia sp.]
KFMRFVKGRYFQNRPAIFGIMERNPFNNSGKTDKITCWLCLGCLFHDLVIIQQNRLPRKAGFLQDENGEATEVLGAFEY